MAKKAEPPFYFLDGEILVRLIKQEGDKAIICFPNTDVSYAHTVEFDRLLNDKKIKEYNEEDLIIFISGSVTSKGTEQAIKDFKSSEEMLKTSKFKKVVNVFDLVEVSPDKTWKDYMIETYSIFLDCNAIFMQKGWEASKGACIEHSIAKILGYIIFYE